jgi:hypothetical protein
MVVSVIIAVRSLRMLPSVIGGPAGCLGTISIWWRDWRRVKVRWRTFFCFSRFAQCSYLCAGGVVSVLVRNSIHKGTVSGLTGAGHQLCQLLLRVGDLCQGLGDGRAVQEVISPGFRVRRQGCSRPLRTHSLSSLRQHTQPRTGERNSCACCRTSSTGREVLEFHLAAAFFNSVASFSHSTDSLA